MASDAFFDYSEIRLDMEAQARPSLPYRSTLRQPPYDKDQFKIGVGYPPDPVPVLWSPKAAGFGRVAVRGIATGAYGYPSMIRSWINLFTELGVNLIWNEPLCPPNEDTPHWRRYAAGEESFGLSSTLELISASNLGTAKMLINASVPTSWVALRNCLNIGYTMFEADHVPQKWIVRCNEMDLVWVPSPWVRDMFISSGVTVPVLVAPHLIDTRVFHPGVAPMIYQGGDKVQLRFLAVADWSPRKNLWATVEAFGETFSGRQDAELVLRTWSDDQDYINPCLDAARRHRVRIVILNRPIPEELLPSFFRAHDVLVVSSSGEGFGLVPYEAMACGLPTILPKANAFLGVGDSACQYVPTKRAPADPNHVFYRGCEWDEVEVGPLGLAMGLLADHPDRRKSLAEAGHLHVIENYGPVAMAKTAIELLEKSMEVGGKR